MTRIRAGTRPRATIALATGALLLAACSGSSSTEADPDGDGVDPGAETTALVWGSGEWGSSTWGENE